MSQRLKPLFFRAPRSLCLALHARLFLVRGSRTHREDDLVSVLRAYAFSYPPTSSSGDFKFKPSTRIVDPPECLRIDRRIALVIAPFLGAATLDALTSLPTCSAAIS